MKTWIAFVHDDESITVDHWDDAVADTVELFSDGMEPSCFPMVKSYTQAFFFTVRQVGQTLTVVYEVNFPESIEPRRRIADLCESVAEHILDNL